MGIVIDLFSLGASLLMLTKYSVDKLHALPPAKVFAGSQPLGASRELRTRMDWIGEPRLSNLVVQTANFDEGITPAHPYVPPPI